MYDTYRTGAVKASTFPADECNFEVFVRHLLTVLRAPQFCGATFKYDTEHPFTTPINSRLNVVVRSPTPFWVGSKWLLAFPWVPITRSTLIVQAIFSPCCERPQKGSTQPLKSVNCFVSSACPFSHPSPDKRQRSPLPCPHLFLFSVRWRGRLVQCYTCSKWVYLRCSLLSSILKTLGSSHSWSCSSCCIPASGGPTPTKTVSCSSDSSNLYSSTFQPGPSDPSLPVQHSRPTFAFKHSTLLPPTSYPLPLQSPHVSGCFPIPLPPLTRSGFLNG